MTPNNNEESPARTGLDQILISAMLILLAVVLAYANAISLPIHGMDVQYIAENAPLADVSRFIHADAPPGVGPLAMFSIALDMAIAGGPGAFSHGINILIHFANGLLVYLLCLSLFGKSQRRLVPLFAALIFVLHPLNTEAVNYIIGRGILLGTFGSLLAVVLFLRAKAKEGAASSIATAGSLAAFVLAWGAHSVAVIVPIIILAADHITTEEKFTLGRLHRHAIYWIALAVLLVAQSAANGITIAEVAASSAWAPYAHAFLLDSLIMPIDLGIQRFTSVEVISWAEDRSFFVIMWASLSTLVVISYVALKKRRTVGFGVMWYALAVIAAWSGVDYYEESRAYCTVVGAVIVFAGLINALCRWPRIAPVAGIVSLASIVGAGAITFQRNTQWRDPAVLWSQALESNPDNPSVLHEVGRIHLRRGEGALDTAVAVSQQGSSAVANQAMEDAQESFVEAESWFAKVVAAGPENASAAYYHGLSLFYVERYDEALVALLDSLRLNPWQQEAALRVAMLLQADADESDDRDLRLRAAEYYALAERLGPLPAEIAPRYAAALTALGDLEESARVWESAGSGVNVGERESIRAAVASQQRLIDVARQRLAVDPHHAQALAALGKAHFDAGRHLKASYILEEVLAQDGSNLQAWMMLGLAKATMGTPKTFAAEWPAPPSPAMGSGWLDLASACATASMWDEALVYLESPAAKADNIERPLVTLVDVAWEQGSREKLEELLKRATTSYPDDATPWLRLFDLSVSRSNGEGAAAYLDRAEALGAPSRDITSRRSRLQ